MIISTVVSDICILTSKNSYHQRRDLVSVLYLAYVLFGCCAYLRIQCCGTCIRTHRELLQIQQRHKATLFDMSIKSQRVIVNGRWMSISKVILIFIPFKKHLRINEWWALLKVSSPIHLILNVRNQKWFDRKEQIQNLLNFR